MSVRVVFDTGDPVLARAAWSRIAEPGDRDAGVLVRSLGPVAALEWLLEAADGGRDGEAAVVIVGDGRGGLNGSEHGVGSRAAGRGGQAGHGPGSDGIHGGGQGIGAGVGDGGERGNETREVGAGVWDARERGNETREVGAGVRRAVARWRRRLEGLDPRRELRVVRGLGGRFVTPNDGDWPGGLNDLGDAAPLGLWAIGGEAALGDLAGFLTPSVAVVGSRAATHYGETVTATMVSGLVERRVAIVSGGAFGIDGAAHRAALGHGGRTVAVMAGGVDRLYPAGNEEMLREVARSGAVVSEVPPGSAPRRERFLSRNRLIAALTSATVVVEAGWRSGARNTAGHAASLVRAVGAVPGPVTSASSAGCHRLVRDGIATLVADAADVMELAGPLVLDLGACEPEGPAGLLDNLDLAERHVLDSLPARGAARLESLTAAAGLSPRAVMAALGALERAGHVRRVGSMWARAS
ncbi:MAG: DNA-processing protein DprA [Bifidobacteriaceae bacterium]|nr:DNA-processing protein DprA [Bifidobacteriaceae bacterium]